MREKRIRRSLLWVTALNEEKFRAGLMSNVDAIVMDLEDTVPLKDKDLARDKTIMALKTIDFAGKEKVVRVNNINTALGIKDLEEILPAYPDAIRLPKCETIEYVLKADEIITRFEKGAGLPVNTIKLILMIETPLGIVNSYQLFTCCTRIDAAGIGSEDLTTELGVKRSYEIGSDQLLYAKQKIINDAKAAGIQALDACSMRNDADYVLNDSLKSKSYGFDGRSVMYVDDIDAVNRAFSPSKEEISWAEGILAADKAKNMGANDNPLYGDWVVDLPVVKKAERILALAKR